jgi:SulP family sulfate permease
MVLSFEGINFVDSQASDAVGKIIDDAHSHNVEVGLSRVKARVRNVLERDGVIERLGPDHMYASTYEAVVDLARTDDDTL